MTAWFVWLRGFRGPRAEIWRDHVEIYRSRAGAQVLGFRKLTEAEAGEPLDRLAKKYPLETIPDD